METITPASADRGATAVTIYAFYEYLTEIITDHDSAVIMPER
jgi:hypothetical protein